MEVKSFEPTSTPARGMICCPVGRGCSSGALNVLGVWRRVAGCRGAPASAWKRNLLAGLMLSYALEWAPCSKRREKKNCCTGFSEFFHRVLSVRSGDSGREGCNATESGSSAKGPRKLRRCPRVMGRSPRFASSGSSCCSPGTGLWV